MKENFELGINENGNFKPVFLCGPPEKLNFLFGVNGGTREFWPSAFSRVAMNSIIATATKERKIGVRVGRDGEEVFNTEEKRKIFAKCVFDFGGF